MKGVNRGMLRLLGLLLLGGVLAWVLFVWPFRHHNPPDSFILIHSVVLLGGMGALVPRFLLGRHKPLGTPGLPQLVLVGLLADRLLVSGVFGAEVRGLLRFMMPGRLSQVMEIVFGGTMALSFGGLMLLGGLGAMCILAETWDLSWAKACMAVLGVVALCAGSIAALSFFLDKIRPYHVRSIWMEWALHLLVLLFELAWFSWWANRICNRLGEAKR